LFDDRIDKIFRIIFVFLTFLVKVRKLKPPRGENRFSRLSSGKPVK
jgi:hypothetical protein